MNIRRADNLTVPPIDSASLRTDTDVSVPKRWVHAMKSDADSKRKRDQGGVGFRVFPTRRLAQRPPVQNFWVA